MKFEGEYLFDKKYYGKLYDINGNIIIEINDKYDNNVNIDDKDNKTFIYFCKDLSMIKRG